jgi:hypothetical protein
MIVRHHLLDTLLFFVCLFFLSVHSRRLVLSPSGQRQKHFRDKIKKQNKIKIEIGGVTQWH